MPKGGRRSGAGRRSTGRTKELRLYVTPEVDEKLSAIAKAQKVPKGQIVENLLKQHEVTMYIDTADYALVTQKAKTLNKAFAATIKRLSILGEIKNWTLVGEIARGYPEYPHDYPCSPLTCAIKSPFVE